LNIALGSASTTAPSISITPSFFAITSSIVASFSADGSDIAPQFTQRSPNTASHGRIVVCVPGAPWGRPEFRTRRADVLVYFASNTSGKSGGVKRAGDKMARPVNGAQPNRLAYGVESPQKGYS